MGKVACSVARWFQIEMLGGDTAASILKGDMEVIPSFDQNDFKWLGLLPLAGTVGYH
jgi:hypothetical protein